MKGLKVTINISMLLSAVLPIEITHCNRLVFLTIVEEDKYNIKNLHIV